MPSLLPPDVVQSQFGPADLPFNEDLYFGKIDWELTDRDRLEVSCKVRREDQADNIGVAQAAVGEHRREEQRHALRPALAAQCRHVDQRALVTYEKTFNAPTPISFGNGSIYT